MLLIGVFFWGATFTFVKRAVAEIDAYSFLAVRFFLAAAILCVVYAPRLRRMDGATLVRGAVVGVVLAAAFIFQTVGLKVTSASNSAFITGLCVVFVPVAAGVLDRRAPGAPQAISVLAALGGLALLTYKPGLRFNSGDLWSLACAFTFGLQIILISRYAGGSDAALFTIVQLLVVAVVSAACGAVFNGGLHPPRGAVVWKAVIFCAVFASAYIYAVQAFLQKYLSEIKAAIIYSFEPLFAAAIAHFALGEPVTAATAAGGALIFLGMLLSELKNTKKTQ